MTRAALMAAIESPHEGPVSIPRDGAQGTIARTGQTFTYRYMMGTLALALAAHRAGARPGDVVTVKYWRFTPEPYRMTATGGGDRTPAGVWMESVR